MLEKKYFCFALLLVNISFVVGGSDYSLARNASRKTLAKASECFPEFSVKQGETVQKLGKTREACASVEASSEARLQEDVSNFSYEMAKLADGFCVQIDNDCRDKYAQDGNISAALDCYVISAINGRLTMQTIAEQSSMKELTVENEKRSIIATGKNCTIQADFDYIRTSDSLFGQFVKCEDGDGQLSPDISTTLQSPVQSTTPSTEGLSESTTVIPPGSETIEP